MFLVQMYRDARFDFRKFRFFPRKMVKLIQGLLFVKLLRFQRLIRRVYFGKYFVKYYYELCIYLFIGEGVSGSFVTRILTKLLTLPPSDLFLFNQTHLGADTAKFRKLFAFKAFRPACLYRCCLIVRIMRKFCSNIRATIYDFQQKGQSSSIYLYFSLLI